MAQDDRRRYPRIKAPVLCRPAGLRLHGQGETQDIGLGGARVYSDEQTEVGTPLELELFLPDGSSVECKAEVAWSEALPAGAPARFEVGLRFTDISALGLGQLKRVLET